jgi:short-subunit dehydrogenase
VLTHGRDDNVTRRPMEGAEIAVIGASGDVGRAIVTELIMTAC